MKYIFLLVLMLFFGCKTETKKNAQEINETTTKNKTARTAFLIGDVDNDKIIDTAYLSEEKNFEVKIKFSKHIPEITLTSLGSVIKETQDLNGDQANEIIIFSRTQEGWWNNVSVWTFKKRKWEELGSVKAFIEDDNDFENRIVKETDQYYLIGEDQWHEDEKGEFVKTKVSL